MNGAKSNWSREAHRQISPKIECEVDAGVEHVVPARHASHCTPRVRAGGHAHAVFGGHTVESLPSTTGLERVGKRRLVLENSDGDDACSGGELTGSSPPLLFWWFRGGGRRAYEGEAGR